MAVLNGLCWYWRATAPGQSQQDPAMLVLETFVHAAEQDPAVVVPPSFTPLVGSI
jgi:hypothetical protein